MADLKRIYDVLVVGGGNAALCAAITAREAGASVLLLEYAPQSLRGGDSRHTRNFRVVHDTPGPVLTGTYAEDECWKDLLRATEGATDEKLARVAIRESATLAPWMRAHGVRFQPALKGEEEQSRTNTYPLGGGKAMLNACYATAGRLGVDILYDTEVRALQLEDGLFRSASVVSKGFPETVRARAVVAASGGFQANIEWLKRYWGEGAGNFLVRGSPYNTGTILRNLLDQGAAAVGDPTQCHAAATDARAPAFDSGTVMGVDSVPFSIMVDRNSRRFYDEGEDLWGKRYGLWGRLLAKLPGQIAYSIFDAKAMPLFIPPVYPALQGQTIAELAAQLGLDAAALETTVREFNGAVRPGHFDPSALDGCATHGLAPPKTHWARALDTPPYFGVPLRPGITFTYLGVKIDEQACVIMSNGRASENLFAAGEIMIGNVLGKGYLAGFGITLGVVFGRIAGAQAAKYAQH